MGTSLGQFEAESSARSFSVTPSADRVCWTDDSGRIGSWWMASEMAPESSEEFIDPIDIVTHPAAAHVLVAEPNGVVATYPSLVSSTPVFDGVPSSLSFNWAGDRLAVGGADGSVTVLYDSSRAIGQPFLPPRPMETMTDARPAVGVLVTHEQSWSMRGIALGELLHGTSLAPGEITQLAVTSKTRSVNQRSVDSATQAESLDQSAASSGSLNETEAASAHESSFGFAFGSTSSSTREDGGGFLVASGGSSSTSSSAVKAAFSSGHRNVADVSNQSLHQQAHDRANQSRSRYTAAVREVSEHESHEMQTRVVANYNHMHALNLQMYEVVQVMSLRTKVVDAHRLLFVPVKAVEFSDDVAAEAMLERFPTELADILSERGEANTAACVRYLFGGRVSVKLRQKRISTIWAQAVEAKADQKGLTEQANKARETASRSAGLVLKARDEIREAERPGFYEKDRLKQQLADRRHQSKEAEAEAVRLEAEAARARDRYQHVRRIQSALLSFLPSSPSTVVPTLTDEVLTELLERVVETLSRHELAVNQELWARMPAHEWAAVLQGRSYKGHPIGAEVDPAPVAVAGHMVGFRWHHADPADELRLQAQYAASVPDREATVTLPTGGVFGEAILGESNVADRIDITRFWNWNDSLPPIRPTEIGPLTQGEDEVLHGPTREDVQSSTVNLGPITFPNMASGIPNVVGAVTNQDLFKDMGTSTAASLATSAMQLSSEGSQEAAEVAASNLKRYLDFQSQMADVALEHSRAQDGKVDPTVAGAMLNERGSQGASGDSPSPAGGGRKGVGTGSGSTSATEDATEPAPVIELVDNDTVAAKDDNNNKDDDEDGDNT